MHNTNNDQILKESSGDLANNLEGIEGQDNYVGNDLLLALT